VYVSPPTSTAAAASPGQEQRRPQHPPASRDSFFDNAKILTLVLVVSGHFWEPLVQEPGHRFIHAAYLLVYTFHMPVFVFISGYFSRSFSAQPRQLRRLLTGVLIPYLVWSTLLDLFTNWALHSHTPVNPLVPTWITWFLLSLFLWRLTAPLWKIIKAPIAIAMAISVAAGAFPVTAELSIARTLQFLPFFVAGMTLGPEHVARIKDSRALSVAALPVFAVAAAVCYWAVPHAPISWFYRTGSTAGLHVGFARWAVESLAINLGGASSPSSRVNARGSPDWEPPVCSVSCSTPSSNAPSSTRTSTPQPSRAARSVWPCSPHSPSPWPSRCAPPSSRR
jgi:fucose 4-O-acetylase-like acetyltransferase